MSEATFDTLSAARALEGAGMDSAQAEVVVETVRSAVIQGTATKADIADLRAEMRADLAALELRLTSNGIVRRESSPASWRQPPHSFGCSDRHPGPS